MDSTPTASLQELAGPDMVCYCCGPSHPSGLRIRSHWDAGGECVVTRYTPRPEYIGFPGIVYGGLLAMLADCHCGWTAMAWHYRAEGRAPESLPRIHCVTGKLELEYLKPTPMGVELELRAWVEGEVARKTRVRGEIRAGDLLTVRLDSVFVRVDTAQLGARAHGTVLPPGLF